MNERVFSVGQSVTFRIQVQAYDPETDAYVDLTTPDSIVLLIEGPDGAARDDVPEPTQVGATNVFCVTYTLDEPGQWYAQGVVADGQAKGLNRRVASRFTVERQITTTGS